jgi:hypothetical protein
MSESPHTSGCKRAAETTPPLDSHPQQLTAGYNQEFHCPSCHLPVLARELVEHMWYKHHLPLDHSQRLQAVMPKTLDTTIVEFPPSPELAHAWKTGSVCWLTTETGIRHKPLCRWFAKTKGRMCTKPEGRTGRCCRSHKAWLWYCSPDGDVFSQRITRNVQRHHCAQLGKMDSHPTRRSSQVTPPGSFECIACPACWDRLGSG